MNLKRPTYTEFLPATPVSEEMRVSVEKIAEENGVSKAQVMRTALSLFLAGYPQNLRVNDAKDEGNGPHLATA